MTSLALSTTTPTIDKQLARYDNPIIEHRVEHTTSVGLDRSSTNTMTEGR